MIDIEWPDYIIPRKDFADHTESESLDEHQITDQIVWYCNEMLSNGIFEELNELLSKLPVDVFTSQECVSWLTWTYPRQSDRDKLGNRPALFDRCRARLVELYGEERAERLTKNRK
jgi:hypothetical protein